MYLTLKMTMHRKQKNWALSTSKINDQVDLKKVSWIYERKHIENRKKQKQREFRQLVRVDTISYKIRLLK